VTDHPELEARRLYRGARGVTGSGGLTSISRSVHDKALERSTLTVQEAAEVLGLSPSMIYKMSKNGQLPTTRAGRRVLVMRHDPDATSDARLVDLLAAAH
jgi:excisionase family DNA binding protein